MKSPKARPKKIVTSIQDLPNPVLETYSALLAQLADYETKKAGILQDMASRAAREAKPGPGSKPGAARRLIVAPAIPTGEAVLKQLAEEAAALATAYAAVAKAKKA